MFVFLRVSGQSGLVNHSFFLAHSIMASSSNPVPPQAPPSGSQEKLFDECICSELQKRGGKTTASTRGEHTEHCTGNERISTHASLPISNDSQISGEISGNCIFLELADFQRNFRKPRSGPSQMNPWESHRLFGSTPHKVSAPLRQRTTNAELFTARQARLPMRETLSSHLANLWCRSHL